LFIIEICNLDANLDGLPSLDQPARGGDQRHRLDIPDKYTHQQNILTNNISNGQCLGGFKRFEFSSGTSIPSCQLACESRGFVERNRIWKRRSVLNQKTDVVYAMNQGTIESIIHIVSLTRARIG
jgi:hypothetical protein